MKTLRVMYFAAIAAIMVAASTERVFGQAVQTISAANGQPTIALVAVKTYKENDWSRDTARAAFEEALLKAGRFTVLSRSQIEAALSEHKLVASGLTDPSSAAQLGKALGARYVLVVELVTLEMYEEGTIVNKKTVVKPAWTVQVIETESTRLIASKRFRDERKISGSALKGITTVLGAKGTIDLKTAPPKITEAYEEMINPFAADFTKELAAAVQFTSPASASGATAALASSLVVAAVFDGQIALEGGADKGIREGTEFEIISEGDPILASNGKDVIGYRSRTVGRMTAVSIQPKMTLGKLTKSFGPNGAEDASPNISRIQEIVDGKKSTVLAKMSPTQK